ncbi:MAG: hypothetical protein ACXADY_10115, partial [Candidatus Hodarchaeales archaeon]
MNCLNCGFSLEKHYKVCPFCGIPVKSFQASFKKDSDTIKKTYQKQAENDINIVLKPLKDIEVRLDNINSEFDQLSNKANTLSEEITILFEKIPKANIPIILKKLREKQTEINQLEREIGSLKTLWGST